MKITCADCREKFETKGDWFFCFKVEIETGKFTDVLVYACPNCDALMTEKYGAVTMNSGKNIARKKRVLELFKRMAGLISLEAVPAKGKKEGKR